MWFDCELLCEIVVSCFSCLGGDFKVDVGVFFLGVKNFGYILE